MQISDKNFKLLVVGVTILIPAVVTVLASYQLLNLAKRLKTAMITQLPK